ncbi:FAD/NAD-P-binding domain-containing protein [Trametes sanguinea]|nr:FAD/NAD-P-binding domain-containing protein [Trametes sanguinea]
MVHAYRATPCPQRVITKKCGRETLIQTFRVAICGGGIGGLTLAVALSRYPDIRIEVYEAAGQFKEIGAGVMVWERTWKILELLGLGKEFGEIAHAQPNSSPGVGFDYRKSDQPQEGFRFYLFQVPYGCIRFHRAQFLDVLVDHLPSDVAHFGKRLTSYTTPTINLNEPGRASEILLHFADGSSATCDLLIGCDGIKSVIRKQMIEDHVHKSGGDPTLLEHIEPIWSGRIAYRGLIPVHRFKTEDKEHRTIQTPMMYCGKSKHVVSYGISRGSIVNVVAMATQPHLYGTTYDGPWVKECGRDELLDCFAGWEPEVQEMLQCIEKPTKWAICELKPLPFYVQGRIALLGDAAHGMTPHQGAGAGQAIEDAYILAEVLGHPGTTLSTLSQALAAYEAVRLPMANHVLQGSRESGNMYEFNGPLGADLARLGPQIGKQWDWVWKTTPLEEREKALRLSTQKKGPVARL